MIRSPTCFKSPQGKCIDLMLTNSKHSFFGSQTFETGFSDFHHMIYTILKATYTMLPPKTIQCRDYSKFSETDFLMDLANALCSMIPENYNEFEGQVGKLLDKHAPYKKATIRGNNKPHVSKEMRKEIMCRTRYKNIANKTRNEEDIRRYKRQTNEIVKLNKVAKKRYFRSLDPATIGSDKRFWKTFKPFFSNKPSNIQEKIILVENGSRITCDKQIAECFNEYFVNITSTLPIEAYVTPPSYVPLQDPVLNAINKYDNHPSVVSIRNNVANDESFEFHPVNPNDVWNEIRQLDNRPFSYSENECGSNDVLLQFIEFSNVDNCDRSFNATLSNLEYKIV